MNQTISVIVPIYNVEEYLPQCLDSILGQSYSDLQVILIDDGSKDSSGEICDRYARQDHRVQVIHQKNAGGAGAKNTGLRAATGMYLSFVDSDDYLEPDAYQYMVELLRQEEADLVRCGFRNVYRNRTEAWQYDGSRRVISGEDFLKTFAEDWTCGLLWNKLYKRELFEGIFFEEGHKIDDEYFTYQGVMNARKAVCDGRIVYNYRKRASSVMGSPESRKQISFDRIDFMVKRREKVIARYPQLRKDFDVSFLNALTYYPDFPDNSVESIQAYRAAGKAYFLQPGNTFPPRYLLRGLLRLYLTPAEKLVEQGAKNKTEINPEDYFL